MTIQLCFMQECGRFSFDFFFIRALDVVFLRSLPFHLIVCCWFRGLWQTTTFSLSLVHTMCVYVSLMKQRDQSLRSDHKMSDQNRVKICEWHLFLKLNRTEIMVILASLYQKICCKEVSCAVKLRLLRSALWRLLVSVSQTLIKYLPISLWAKGANIASDARESSERYFLIFFKKIYTGNL